MGAQPDHDEQLLRKAKDLTFLMHFLMHLKIGRGGY